MKMAATNLLNMTLSELGQALRSKTVSVVQVVEQVLSQKDVMQDLNALISSTPQTRLWQCVERAQQRQDADSLLGPLDGVPVVVKDNYCTSWSPTTCASSILKTYTPPYNATLVSRMENAGAIIIGKSNMDEFGMGSGGTASVFGATKNVFRSGRPYTLQGMEDKCGSLPDGSWLASGGSSSGSAVAVAAGLAYCALGSDTGGSVRNPASLCGVVGLKPSYGALPRTGLVSLVNSLDCPGLLARSCDDCDAAMGVLVGEDDCDSTSCSINYPAGPLPVGSPEGLVVGVPREYYCAGLHRVIVSKWEQLADALCDAGAKVVPVSLPHTPHAPACYTVLNTCEVASNFARYTGVQYGTRVPCDHSMEAQYALTRAAGLSQVVRDRVLAGSYFLLRQNRDRYYEQAMKVRRLILQDFLRVWESGVQVLLTPTTLFPAPRPELFLVKNYSELTYLQDLCTSPANLAGVPALSLPVGYTGDDEGYGRQPSPVSARDSSFCPKVGQDSSDTCDMTEGDVVGADHGIEGLPLSLQLMGPYGSDRMLLQLGKWVELALNVPRITLKDPL